MTARLPGTAGRLAVQQGQAEAPRGRQARVVRAAAQREREAPSQETAAWAAEPAAPRRSTAVPIAPTLRAPTQGMAPGSMPRIPMAQSLTILVRRRARRARSC